MTITRPKARSRDRKRNWKAEDTFYGEQSSPPMEGRTPQFPVIDLRYHLITSSDLANCGQAAPEK